jgi:radical SAM superfamily enzyme YgiQ (UPF0313 family)
MDTVEHADTSQFHTMYTSSGADRAYCYPRPCTEVEAENLLSILRNINPDCVGISLSYISFDTAAELTRLIQSRLSVPVAWGGIAPTSEPERSIQIADFLCIGEGEMAFADLADAIGSSTDTSHISNIWARNGSKVCKNPPRPLIQELDTLPFPDYSPENKYLIEKETVAENYGFADSTGPYDIMTARGCPFSCSFCANELIRSLYPGQQYVRRRSVSNVISELKSAKSAYGNRMSYVSFFDDVFTIQQRWLEEFAERYPSEVGLPFWCFTHPSASKPEMLALLKKAGAHRITSGLQSGSERILRDVYNRRTSRQQMISMAEHLEQLGVRYDFDIITNNPLETDDDCHQTLDLLLRLPAPVRLNDGVIKLYVYPNTEIARKLNVQPGLCKVDEKRYAFFNRLYVLAQSQRLRPLLRFLSRRRFLSNHPKLLHVLLLIRVLKRRLWIFLDRRAPRLVPLLIRRSGM